MTFMRVKNSIIKNNIAKYSLFILTPMLFDAPAVQAQIWNGNQSNNWGDALNWNSNQVPTGTSNVVVNAGSNKVAIVDGQSGTAHKLVIGSELPGGANDGEVHVINGGTLTAEGFVILGETEGTVGRLVVSGENSTFKINSVQFFLGDGGEGHFLVKEGGQFITKQDTTIFTGQQGNTGTSSFIVTGQGTKADIGTLLLSYSQNAAPSDHTTIFNVTDGAVVDAVQMNWGYSGKAIVNIDQATVNMNGIIAGYNEGSEALTLITGENASLNIGGLMQFGSSGRSETRIEKGAYFKTGGSANLGLTSTGEGIVVIDGAGSRWDALTNIYVGADGKGAISVENGGRLDSKNVIMGYGSTAEGVINVSGAGSYWTSADTTFVADKGKAHISITNGGKAELEEIYASNSESGTSTVLVSDAASELTVDGILLMGEEGTAHLVAEKGARVNAGYAAAANNASSVGSFTVTGEGTEFINTDEMAIGIEGKGTLTVTDKARLSSVEKITLGEETGSEGTLNIGTGAHAGRVEAPEVFGGEGNATVNFNHVDEIAFDAALKGRLNVNHINNGLTTLTAESDHSGTASVLAGRLRAGKEHAFSTNADYVTAAAGTLDLDNYNQNIGSLMNSGRVYFGNKPGTALNIVKSDGTSGDYQGKEGTIYFSTVLGDDNSVTDIMNVGGDTSGHSFVKVTNAGGLGAYTKEGIKIIDVAGQSEGDFSLLGDFTYKGEQVVAAGAYMYTLNQGATSTPDDGHWYLQSEYRGGIVPYEVYPQILLNTLPTLQQRVGNRFWNNAGNKVLAQGADMPEPFATPEESGPLIEENSFWGRMEGTHTSIKPSYSTLGAEYDYNTFKLQAGLDGMLAERESGKLIGGITVHYDHKSADIYSRLGDSEIKADGYGFGGTLTWYGIEGFYSDNQAEFTWYRSDIHSSEIAKAAVDNNKGFSYSLSTEAGKRVTLDEHWSLTPQGQLVYAHASFDDFTDVFGADVSLKRAESLQGRLGLSLDYQNSWMNDRGMINRSYAYGIANLYHEFLNGTKVNVSGLNFANKSDRWWAGIGLGGSYNWNDDKYSIYGEGLVTTSLNHFADSYAYKGTIGMRIKW